MGDLYKYDPQVGRIDPTKEDYVDYVRPNLLQRGARWLFEKFHPQFKKIGPPLEERAEDYYPALELIQSSREYEKDFRQGMTSDHPGDLIPVDAELEHGRYTSYPMGPTETSPMHAPPGYLVNDDNYMDPQTGLRNWHLKRLRREYVGICPPVLYEGIRSRLVKCQHRFPHTLIVKIPDHPCQRLEALLTKCLMLRDTIWTPARYHALSAWMEERAQFARWADVGLPEVSPGWLRAINRDLYTERIDQTLYRRRLSSSFEDYSARMDKSLSDEMAELLVRLDLRGLNRQAKLNLIHELHKQFEAHRIAFYGAEYYTPSKTLLEIVEEQRARLQQLEELADKLDNLHRLKVEQRRLKERALLKNMRASVAKDTGSNTESSSPQSGISETESADSQEPSIRLTDLPRVLKVLPADIQRGIIPNNKLKMITHRINIRDPYSWIPLNELYTNTGIHGIIQETLLDIAAEDEALSAMPTMPTDIGMVSLEQLLEMTNRATEIVKREIEVLKKQKAQLQREAFGIPAHLVKPNTDPSKPRKGKRSRDGEDVLTTKDKIRLVNSYNAATRKDKLMEKKKKRRNLQDLLDMLPRKRYSRTTRLVSDYLDKSQSRRERIINEERYRVLNAWYYHVRKLIKKRKAILKRQMDQLLQQYGRTLDYLREQGEPADPHFVIPNFPDTMHERFQGTLVELEERIMNVHNELRALSEEYDTLLPPRDYFEDGMGLIHTSREFEELQRSHVPLPPPKHPYSQRGYLLFFDNSPYTLYLARTRELRRVLAYYRYYTEHEAQKVGNLDYDALYDMAIKTEQERILEGKEPTKHRLPLAPWQIPDHPDDLFKKEVEEICEVNDRALERHKALDEMGRKIVGQIVQPIWPQYANEWKERMKKLLYEDGGFESSQYAIQREYYLAELGRRREKWGLPEIPGREIHPFGWPSTYVTYDEIADDIVNTRLARNLGWLPPYQVAHRLLYPKEYEPPLHEYGNVGLDLIKPDFTADQYTDQRQMWPAWFFDHPDAQTHYYYPQYIDNTHEQYAGFRPADDYWASIQDKEPNYLDPDYHPAEYAARLAQVNTTEDQRLIGTNIPINFLRHRLAEDLDQMDQVGPQLYEEPTLSVERQQMLRDRALRAKQQRTVYRRHLDPSPLARD